ncbi:transglycosylase SLT domain-containing protein [Pseudonocardia kunmingensis]|uniref:Transglycosylase-like protein with SLT domain n=1 Tax=Pseudonocardia kunmingensis TaxID=630975 RepID=A0A543CZ74_9PSEU|nr:transglycosylase SLT domain-containing protein [Pseudonocardia kunmingensis]TQM02198.1 transglycosylase-like protein with SLT domain [Pseudonocardia kunmingensis]
MAGHRSPRGVRAPRTSQTGRHQAAHRPPPAGPSLGTTVLATTAAVGAVATGAFTALLPTPADGTTTTAAADAPLDAMLAAESSALESAAATGVASVAVLPVELAAESVPADEHLARLVQGAEIAELHAEQAREEARIAALIERGGVDGWIAEALQVLDLPQDLASGVKKIVMAESGGNPRAINNWDSNARRGTPSQGLMQTIPSTYKHYVHPELDGRPITDPVANITAGVRYMIDNYGMDTLEKGGRSNSAGSYVGY